MMSVRDFMFYIQKHYINNVIVCGDKKEYTFNEFLDKYEEGGSFDLFSAILTYHKNENKYFYTLKV